MAIVVGHLSTPEGQEALTTAVTEARQRDVPLVVVTSAGRGDDADRAAAIASLESHLANAGVQHSVVAGTGDLAEDLVRVAAESDAELIVIGLRRRSPVGKLILGSGAQRILLESPCPVLAVKP
ncbi:universal stress protein [Isoptericola variabilis]|uniref:UspA domain-containing protein n=1 Tax=Isoptericola variabilis (strain 225) TaxID=743718 RepID=F6FWH9_ISOV2|nr:universal stress protein [Isoptericola variabilis]AEG44553.1 UspA domain-containing protein [Isoptericola variabilis 225]TWH26530.1 Universal stress protein UspA and related nucleotide-binding proteins [Isoptericola variabilis J7]